MPRGSEQPAVLKYTVTQQFTQAVKRKETTAPSQAKRRSPVRSHPHILMFPLPGAASGPGREILSRGAGLPFPGIFSSQLFPGSQCLLLQGRVDVPTAQHSTAQPWNIESFGRRHRRTWKEQRKDTPSQKHGWHHTHAAAGQDPSPHSTHSHTTSPTQFPGMCRRAGMREAQGKGSG